MVILCDARHNQKLKYLIFLKYEGILYFLNLALAFLTFKMSWYLMVFGITLKWTSKHSALI